MAQVKANHLLLLPMPLYLAGVATASEVRAPTWPGREEAQSYLRLSSPQPGWEEAHPGTPNSAPLHPAALCLGFWQGSWPAPRDGGWKHGKAKGGSLEQGSEAHLPGVDWPDLQPPHELNPWAPLSPL